jgi:gliding motility-associated-like protein
MQRIISILLLLMAVLFVRTANATHIVGGEITYKCVRALANGSKEFEIQLVIYQDCLNGEPPAISQDTPAYIGIFDKGVSQGSYNIIDTTLYPETNILVDPNFSNECVNNPPPTCLRRVTFRRRYILPPSAAGYRIIYVRCCRNATILNIRQPSEMGATYSSDIPPFDIDSPCPNNSANFVNTPPQIICIDNPFIYDHSAIDPDGDSLSYEFCEAYSGSNRFDPKPAPFPSAQGSPLAYNAGYSAIRPMGGNPVISIDQETGLIRGTPNIIGRFVVSVCCNEWRNGQIINTVKRELQFVVTNCSKAVVANIPVYSAEANTYVIECKSKTVRFDNKSLGNPFSFYWDFGVPGATSTEFSPTYTYPDTGTYDVKLVVNRGSTCPDSITRQVKIFPEFRADYEFTGLPCPGLPITFTDKSTATFPPIIGWEWNFGGDGTSNEQNPRHTFFQGGTYKVSLVSTSIKGCRDTATKDVPIEPFRPFAGNDTIIVRGERINFRASGGIQYTWTPSTNLNVANISNPTGFYPETGAFGYKVHIRSESGCEGDDSINVYVVADPYAFVPTGFTPNGDGLNDRLRPLLAGYESLQYFRVFNRWGEMVFNIGRIGESEGWDGTYKGTPCDIGTYYWVLSIKNRFGKDELYKGDVTLLR